MMVVTGLKKEMSEFKLGIWMGRHSAEVWYIVLVEL